MNELSKFLVESILGEADSVKNVIVVYAGRFQPFHKGHYATYSHLVKKFGKNNVYIGTSDKTDNQKSPFNFKEKQLTMTKMFGIPSNRIVNVKNPYAPTEVLNKFDEKTTAFVTVVGEKDSSRLGGKYFEKYKDGIEFEGYKDKGYVYIAPAQSNPISGTDVRIGLRKGSDDDKKNFFVKRAYGKYDDKIFNLIVSKLATLPEISEQHIWIPKSLVETWLVNNSDLIVEVSGLTTIGGDVDDGPNFFFPNYNTFNSISKNRAEKIGFTVLSQIMSGELEDYYEHPIYPKGPVKAVTPFPAGVIGKITATNQKDFNSDIAYPKWFNHVTRTAALVGYSLVDSILTKKDKDEVYKFDKLAYTNSSNFVSENIEIPVNIGDTILTGKFKNKKTTIKTIGKDEHGMPTINGKKVVTFRMVNEGTLNENVIANILVKLIVSAGTIVIRAFLGVFIDRVIDGAMRTYQDVKDIVAPEPYIKFLKGLEKNDAFNKQFIQFAIQNRKGNTLIGNSWIEKVTTLPAFVAAYDKFTKEEGIEGMNKSNLLHKISKSMWDTYLRNWKGIYAALKKKYPQLANELPEGKLNEIHGTRFDAIGYDKDGKQVDIYFPRARFGFEKNIVHAAADRLFKTGISKGNGIKYIEIYYNKHHLGTIRLPRNFTKGKDWDKLPITEMPMADLVKIDTYADKQLNPVDVVLTDKHFFERLTDPRNDKPISAAELTGFFKRIAKNKKKFLEFLDQYGQVVAKDNRTNINIPFMKQANRVIAKTIMRKDNYMTSNPIYKFEDVIPGGLAQGLDLTDVANKHKVDIDDLMKEFAEGVKVEMEHTNNAKVAEEIALDHLFEDPKYYTKLAKVEEYAMYRTHIQKPVDKGGLADEINELTKGQLFRGTLKIGGTPVPVEVELLGADNKKKVFVTKVINIDKKYWNRIPSNGILEIPARIFRTPGGGWYKIKTPSVFETQYVGEVAKDDWHYKIIEKIYHKAGPFGKKKIAVVVTSNPNSSWEKIARELRVSDYEDVTEFVKKLGIRENLMFGYPDQKWMDNHEKELKRLRTKFNKEKSKDQYYEPALGGGITEGVVVDGEPETGYIPDGKVRTLGYAGRPEPWFGQGGYTQLHFPKSDAMRGKGKSKDTESSFRKVTYKTSNVKVSTLKKALKPVGSDEWTEVPLNEGLLNEGGAYGHMNHPFDNEINLTFGQLKDIVNRALDGELELAREKTDGQALAISWVNGKLVAARNKGHLANRGANALDAKGVATKFSGRGELEKAYNFAMNDLSKAIGSLSEKQREKIFKNGACFMNLEVIYPTSVNVIPYGQPLLVFHGTMEYNEKGEAIGENQQAAKILAGMIKQVNQNVQSNYTIQGPPVTQLPKNKNLSSLKGKYNSQISKLQSEFKLSDNDGIGEYHQAWWTDFVQKKSPVNVDNTTLMGLVKRWAFYDKGFRLDSKNIKDEKVLVWAQKIDKEDHAKIAKNNIRPFEDIFLGVGAEVLSFMSSVLTANPDAAVRNMKQRLDQTIKDVQTGGDPKKIAKLKLELERLNAIGGKDKIVPNEGIVFVYGGKTFKLTGTFAPLNQILGLFYE